MTLTEVKKEVRKCVYYNGNNNCSICTKCVLRSEWIDEAEDIEDLCDSFEDKSESDESKDED